MGSRNIISGFIQGFGSEIGFALTGYRHFDRWDLFQSGYLAYPFHMLVILFIIRLASIGLFSGVLVAAIQKLLVKTKVLLK